MEANRLESLSNVLNTVTEVRLQAAPDYPTPWCGKSCVESLVLPGVAVLQRALGQMAGEGLVSHNTEGVDIAGFGWRAAEEQLGRHVGRRAGDSSDGERSGFTKSAAREAEVSDAGMNLVAQAVDHDIGSFDIAMKDAGIMGGCNACGHLGDDASGLFRRPGPEAIEPGCERFPGQELHGEKGQLSLGALPMKDVIDGAEVGMNNFASMEYLVLEAILHDGVGRKLRQDGLYGEVDSTQVAILNFVDLAHSTSGDESNHFKTAVEEEIPGFELRCVLRNGWLISARFARVGGWNCCAISSVRRGRFEQGVLEEAASQGVFGQ